MLNKRIRELRIGLGWSQIDLASRLKVSKQAVSNWENDNVQPSIEILVRLADTFGVATDYLLGRENVPSLNVSGLSPEAIGHITLLIQDLKQK